MKTTSGRRWWFFGVNLVFLVFLNRERRLRFVTQTHFPCGKTKGVGGGFCFQEGIYFVFLFLFGVLFFFYTNPFFFPLYWTHPLQGQAAFSNYIGERDLWGVGGIYVELNGSFISIVKGNSFKNIGSSSSWKFLILQILIAAKMIYKLLSCWYTSRIWK